MALSSKSPAVLEGITALKGRASQITLDLPEKRNALSGAMVAALQDCLMQLQASTRDLTCRGVLLRSSVEGMLCDHLGRLSVLPRDRQSMPLRCHKASVCYVRWACLCMHVVAGAFCAGADLKERREHQPADIIRFGDNVRAIIAGLAALPVPVLAALDGAALGGGAELALATDVRTISKRATMGFPETGLGIIPGVGGIISVRCSIYTSLVRFEILTRPLC